MSAPLSPPDGQAPLVARQDLRRGTRAVLAEPGSVPLHLMRLSAALALPGSEPAQGALADLFHALPAGARDVRRAALQLAAPRLAEHVRRSFEARANADTALPRVSALATRWSVLAIPSADVSTRSRRVSADDSRALAAHVINALRVGDLDAQEAFLEHCMTCRDSLAYMLAARQARKEGLALGDAWEDVGAALQKAVETPS